MLGQARWIKWMLSAGFLASGSARAFTYEVLYEDSIGRDAVTLGRQPGLFAASKLVLLDGQVKTSGTETTSYDRIVLNYIKIMSQLSLGPNAALRLAMPAEITYEKQEGEQIPREVSQATWLETKPKIEFTYATQNALDIVLGLDVYYISAHNVKTESANFTATDSYQGAVTTMGHVAIVKHGPSFDGGFYYKGSAEKIRKVTKSTSIDDSTFVVEDRVYDPAAVAIFMQTKQSFGQIFGEFAALEASGGGNRTEKGATVKEDYFRVQVAGMFPVMGSKDTQIESSLIYKSLSYADNRNITMDTIPMFGFQLKLLMNPGVPLFAGIMAVKGSDGQSIPEFNATYKLFGIGAVAGIQMNF